MRFTDTTLHERIRGFAKGRAHVRDVVLFGSTVRGNPAPKDADILVLFEERVDKDAEYELRKLLEQIFTNVDIISKSLSSLHEPESPLRESYLFEGYSIMSGEFISERYGFDAMGMFTYSTRSWTSLRRTTFYHALNGRRGSPGILDELESLRLSDNVLLTPLVKVDLMKEFFEAQRVEHRYIPLLLPSRLNKKRFLSRTGER